MLFAKESLPYYLPCRCVCATCLLSLFSLFGLFISDSDNPSLGVEREVIPTKLAITASTICHAKQLLCAAATAAEVGAVSVLRWKKVYDTRAAC